MNAQGIRGDARVMPSTDDPLRFNFLDHVLLEKKDVLTRYNIERVWFHKQFVILKLEGVNDMNAALALKEALVKIEPEFALALEDDEYYTRDLIGLAVYERGDKESYVGEIDDVLQTGANDVYSVKTADGRTILLPAIKECILDVDIAGKKMTVKLMDGLL